jgi:hypothetical protein
MWVSLQQKSEWTVAKGQGYKWVFSDFFNSEVVGNALVRLNRS